MGGSNNKAAEGASWEQLNQNQHHAETRNQAYSQAVEATYRGGSRADPWASGPKPALGVTEQKLVPVKVDFDMDPKTTALEADPHTANLYHLKFQYTCEHPVMISVHFAAKITVDRQNGIITNIQPKFPNDSHRYTLQPTKSATMDLRMNFNNYTFRELSRCFNDTIPILIIMESVQIVPNSLEKVVYFFQIEQKNLSLSVVSKSRHCHHLGIVIGGRFQNLMDLYGIGKSVLKPNSQQSEEDLCIICYSSGIDTVIKPCNHMCLCHECSEPMRQKADKCPMCRETITSLIILSK